MTVFTETEAAEFRGFFFGEGHLDLARQSSLASLYPRARVAVRDDDHEVLLWCQRMFGGNITRRTVTRSVCWQLTGHDRIGALLDVLEAGFIPSKKRPEVALLREAWGLWVPRGVWLPEPSKQRLLELRDELKHARQYKEAAE